MIQITNLNRVDRASWQEFNGKKYEFLDVEAKLDGESHTRNLLIAGSDLEEDIFRAGQDGDSKNATFVDEKFYAYIPSIVMGWDLRNIKTYIEKHYD